MYEPEHHPEPRHTPSDGHTERAPAASASHRDESNQEAKLLASIAEIERQIGAFKSAHASQVEEDVAFAALCTELVRTRESRDAWEHSWEAAQAEAENSEIQLRKAKDLLAERAQQIEQLQAKLDDSSITFRPFAQEPAQASPTDDSFARLRRARLARYRELVQNEAAKLVEAERLLAIRLRKAKEVEQDNADLRRAVERALIEHEADKSRLEKAALAIKQLKATQPRVAPRVEPSRRGSRLLPAFGVVCLGLASLGGLSWHIAGEFAHSVHLAEMRISAETAGTALGEAQASAWLDYHESLVEDPQVIGLASERLKRRGLVSVSEPGALRKRLAGDLDVMRTGDSTLSLTLRGEGEAQTRRLLETYVLTLVSFANDTRDYREDASATVVTAGASVDASPLETNRVELFAMIAGMSAALCGLLALILARISKPVAAPARAPEHPEIEIPDLGDTPISRV